MLRTGMMLRACLLGIVLGMAGLAGAADDGPVTLNFVNADIESVIKAVSQVSGRNFVIDPRVKGTVNIVSGKPVPRALAYQILISALRLQGYSVVESPTITKVLPEMDAKVQPGPLVARGEARGEQVVTQVFQVRYESAAQLAGVLKPLVSSNQTISSYPGSNTLVITDTADNLQRLEKVIAAIDVPNGEDPQVVTLKHASAVDVAALLGKLFVPGQGMGGSQTPRTLTAVAEPRSNRIVMRADDPALLVRARAVISEFDQAEAVSGNIHVVPLKYADANRMAQTLRAILGGAGTAAPGAVPIPASQAASAPMAPPGTSGGIPTFQGNNPEAGALVSGSTIQADPVTNSLIVIAPESIYRNLRNVIDMLDKRRAQVYIEALVVELTADKAAEFGIQWQDLTGLGENRTRAIGGTNFGGIGQNIITTAQSPGTIGRGLNIGVVKGTINIPGLGTVTNLGLLARFLESENQANILSTPNILTLDNEEAKIVIGQNLPFVTGSYTNTGATGGAVNPFQTFERKDVGLTLKVKPQITDGGVVRVQIYQEASSVQPGTAANPTGPVTNKRSLESHVLVDDGSIIALGGLIEDNYGTGEEKVPFLGDAPLVGGLFRYETKSRKKTNLMVFLRPHIVRDTAGYQDQSLARYEKMQAAQEQFGASRRGWASEPDVPRLPPAGQEARVP